MKEKRNKSNNSSSINSIIFTNYYTKTKIPQRKLNYSGTITQIILNLYEFKKYKCFIY